MISDVQFAQWARSPASKLTTLVEIEAAYQTSTGPATTTICLSDRRYVTQPTDGFPSRRYLSFIRTAPAITRAIDLAKLGGRGTMNIGELVLDNADGSADFLLNPIIDRRSAAIYIGDPSWSRADFRLICIAAVASVKSTNTQLTITLADKNVHLNDTVIGSPIGSGPNAGKSKPIALGYIKNLDITPYCLDATALTYYVNDFALSGVVPRQAYACYVRDSGAALSAADQGPLFSFSGASMTADASTDTMTRTTAHGLSADDVIFVLELAPGGDAGPFAGFAAQTQYWVLASGLTATQFKLSATKGGSAIDITSATFVGTTWFLYRGRCYVDTANAIVQLSSTPAGQLTADLAGYDASGIMSEPVSPHKVFKYVLQNYSQLSASEFDSATMDALAATEATVDGAGLGIFFGAAILDRVNLLDLLDQIARATYSWYGWDSGGVLRVGRLDLANLDNVTPIKSVAKTDIIGDVSCENAALPWGRVILDADKNFAVQTSGLVGSVNASDRTRWGQQFETRVTTTTPVGADYLGHWWNYHASATDSAPIDTGAVSGIGASGANPSVQGQADAITTLFKPWTRIFRCTVGLEFYALNPGDCISVAYPRFGLDDGQNFRVVSIATKPSDRTCDLVLVRQTTPDYLTATYF